MVSLRFRVVLLHRIRGSRRNARRGADRRDLAAERTHPALGLLSRSAAHHQCLGELVRPVQTRDGVIGAACLAGSRPVLRDHWHIDGRLCGSSSSRAEKYQCDHQSLHRPRSADGAHAGRIAGAVDRIGRRRRPGAPENLRCETMGRCRGAATDQRDFSQRIACTLNDSVPRTVWTRRPAGAAGLRADLWRWKPQNRHAKPPKKPRRGPYCGAKTPTPDPLRI